MGVLAPKRRERMSHIKCHQNSNLLDYLDIPLMGKFPNGGLYPLNVTTTVAKNLS